MTEAMMRAMQIRIDNLSRENRRLTVEAIKARNETKAVWSGLAVMEARAEDAEAQLATACADALRAAAEACSDEYFREMSSISDGAVMELCDKQMEASKRSILALIDKETDA